MQTAADSKREAAQRGEQAKAERKQGKVKRDAEKLVEIMRQYPAGETKNVLKTIAGFNGARIDAALHLLVERGKVVETMVKKSKKRNGVLGYRLA